MPAAGRDLPLLLAARMLRLFSYGFLAVVLALYLGTLGYSPAEVGVMLTLTLLGGATLSLLVATRADRLGRRRMLMLGAAMMAAGGAAMAGSEARWLLIVAAILGTVSPTGGETGPFLAIEQAGLAQVIRDEERTRVFAWSHVLGFSANAVGALFGGWLAGALQEVGWGEAASYRALLLLYAAAGVVLLAVFAALTPRVEPPAPAVASDAAPWHGLRESRNTVAKLGSLFALDALGGGFVVQSFVAFWLHRTFGADLAALGWLFFGATLLSGLSALAAVPLARRIGLLPTMVFTHLPSNFLLMLVPFMPTFGAAAAVLLARHAIAQMDVPTRQSYLNAIVPASERSAANGITTTVRQLGAALGPAVAGPLLAVPTLSGWCFVIGGGLKIIYDLVLWRVFAAVKPPEERGRP